MPKRGSTSKSRSRAALAAIEAAMPPLAGLRFCALDALRGLAILAMVLSGQLPFGVNALPAWMYHAQVPPPLHQFIPSPGITWVDLVFPFFLFSMGAAFPLALERRLEIGMPEWQITAGILKRGFLLGFFALFVQAIRPSVLSDHPGTGTWLAALAGFAILFPILARLPEDWPELARMVIRAVGWIGAVLFFRRARYPDGSGFDLGRSDIIIVVLANVALFGSIIWLATRERWLLRLGIMGILLAIRMSNMPHPLGGWVSVLWDYSPAPWIYKLYYLQYLCIVIPGTIAGDLIVKYARGGPFSAPDFPRPGQPMMLEMSPQSPWSAARMGAMAGLMFLFIPVLVIGLKARWLTSTTLVVFGMCVLGWQMVRHPLTPEEQLYKSLFLWAIYWLVLGLVLEPYEGGIRKDKATVSYYFVTSGLANCLLVGFSILADVFKKERWLRLLGDNGQNPMIAYAGINNLVLPILALVGLDRVLDNWSATPWRGFWRGVFVTLLMALATSFFTRKKIFWRT